jgi:peptidoglycan/LPS O-acetylase OafA/YrhL
MFSCLAAATGFLGGWALILTWHALAGGPPDPLTNGLAYAALAIVAMALVGRCAVKWHPALKRVAALLGCAILAGVDVGFSGQYGEDEQKLFFAALLGMALVVLVSRHAPAALRRKWLGEGNV